MRLTRLSQIQKNERNMTGIFPRGIRAILVKILIKKIISKIRLISNIGMDLSKTLIWVVFLKNLLKIKKIINKPKENSNKRTMDLKLVVKKLIKFIGISLGIFTMKKSIEMDGGIRVKVFSKSLRELFSMI